MRVARFFTLGHGREYLFDSCFYPGGKVVATCKILPHLMVSLKVDRDAIIESFGSIVAPGKLHLQYDSDSHFLDSLNRCTAKVLEGNTYVLEIQNSITGITEEEETEITNFSEFIDYMYRTDTIDYYMEMTS